MANRFWILGTGNTSDTAHWSATSGGGGGVSVPVAGDVVSFDTNSGTGTVTDNAGLTCASITHTQASLTVTATAAQTVTGAVTISAGTWITGAFTHSYGSFVSTSGTRTLTLTNSTINVTGTSGTPWNIATTGALTFTATGSTINFNGGAANVGLTLTFGALTYGTVNITGAGSWSITNTPTFANFSYTSTTNKTDALIVATSIITVSAAGTLTLAGNSVVNRAFVKSSVLGTQRSISVPSGATVTLTNVDFQDIASAGTFGTWTGTSLGDCLGNSGITFDASVTQTMNVGSASELWSDVTKWSGSPSRVPLPQDDVVISYSGGTATSFAADMPRLGRNIDWTNYTKTQTFANTPNTIFGNVTLGAGATYSGTQGLTLAGRGAQTITCNGKSFSQQVLIGGFGGTYTAQDNFSSSSIALGPGSFNANNFNVTAASGTIFINATPGTITMGNGIWSIAGTSGNLLNFGGLTVVAGNSTIKLTGTISGTATFVGGGKTYGTLNWSSTTSTGTLIITGANTFAALQSDNTTARTWQFPNGVTQTIQPGGWQINGKPGVNITITSSSAGSQATISMAGGHVVASNIILKDSNAVGGAQWYAGPSSTYNGDVTGWIFRNPASTRHAGRQMYN